jgi:hypothetical protein
MDGAHQNPDAKPTVGEYRRFREPDPTQHSRHRAIAAAYFEARERALDVVTTTQTPSGQRLDWIPVESQQPGDIASPPPVVAKAVRGAEDPGRPTTAARFELEEDGAARGPEGTVPVLRKDLSAIPFEVSLRRHLAKRQGRGHRSQRSGDELSAFPPPEAGGGHRYSESAQWTFNLGAEGYVSVNDPYTEISSDFSLMEMAVTNHEQGYVQTAEVGIQETLNLYGDWGPHLFVYYTTNGYAAEGNNLGGYNRDVDGWVQYDDAIYPGAPFTTVSTPGGDQYDLFMKFQWFDGNWWLMVLDRWIGYYPGALFSRNGSVSPSLADYSTMVGFWGEVYDSDDVPGPTTTTMGSGYWAGSQWPWAAFQRNLRVQVDAAGSMDDYNANGVVINSPSMYDLELHMLSGSDWGSYQYLGGPGAG